ncbi:MAG: sigma-70 family RNA polymerase sigma factor, partial [Planctomycetes bacterium]|nr:sigma-70 family RNA polymerase sigma factor [Planctomycetota bacterium]
VLIQSLNQAVNALPDEEQLLISLAYTHDLSYREISEVTQIPKSNVGRIIHESITKLKDKLFLAGIACIDNDINSSLKIIGSADQTIISKSALIVEKIIESVPYKESNPFTKNIINVLPGGIMTKIIALLGVPAIFSYLLITSLSGSNKPDFNATNKINPANTVSVSGNQNKSASKETAVVDSKDTQPVKPANEEIEREVNISGTVIMPDGSTAEQMPIMSVIVPDNNLSIKELKKKFEKDPFKLHASLLKNLKRATTDKEGKFTISYKYKTMSQQTDTVFIDVSNLIVSANGFGIALPADNTDAPIIKRVYYFKLTKVELTKKKEDINIEIRPLKKAAVILDCYPDTENTKISLIVPDTLLDFIDASYTCDSFIKELPVPAGTEFVLEINKKGFNTFVKAMSSLSEGETKSLKIDFEKSSNAIYGYCINTGGVPISGTTLIHMDNSVWLATTQTDQNGFFNLETTGKSTGLIVARKNGYQEIRINKFELNQRILVIMDKLTDGKFFISAQVINKNGDPVQKAMIGCLQDGTDKKVVYSDQDGFFKIEGLLNKTIKYLFVVHDQYKEEALVEIDTADFPFRITLQDK